ncbi:hypothetical protein [Leptothrix discophora]|uniref:GspL cytoplasmic actin-ATPase-like domain-containing protein n=1 Tax=Leptothrix discophora TaxID=89 RepID=A0ABT9G2Y7_LEPDI|nr:hypothetical protein [Leptothrix discophora]MDP4300543.1 hypothetical protein [Leptothrix discophora]
MSLRFKSELRLNLRMRSCQAELLPPGWNSVPSAVASGSGEGATALSAALSALRLADIQELPRQAALTVGDEYLYYQLLDADLGWGQALQEATMRFSADLGRDDLRVQVVPLQQGERWLAVAAPEPDVQAWSEALALSGVQLQSLHAALVEDLRRLAPQIPENDAVLALLREEGMSLVHIRDGVPAQLAWERFEAADAVTMEQRLRAFVRSVPKADECVVYLLPESQALCRYVWGGSQAGAMQGQATGLVPAPLDGMPRPSAMPLGARGAAASLAGSGGTGSAASSSAGGAA